MVQQYPGFQAQRAPDGSVIYSPQQAQPQYPPQQQPPPQGYYQQPPQQQYGAPPQPQYPPQQYGQQPPQGYGYGAPPAGPPMPPSMPPQQPRGPMVAPAVFYPSAQEFADMNQRATEEAARIAAARSGQGGGSRRKRELKFLGPNGETDWKGVPIGFTRDVLYRLLPSGFQGVAHYIEKPKHFIKTHAHPNGTGGWCPGKETCRVCQGAQDALAIGSEDMMKKAKMARSKPHRLYQGMAYGMLDAHRDEGGRIRPLIYDAPSDVHLKFMDFANGRGGLHVFLDLARGAPFKITRKKFGPEPMNIDYSVIDMLQMAGPLPAEFGFGQNGEGLELYDLHKFAQPMGLEEQQRLVAELGFATGQQYAYSQNPSPPQASPYGQPPPVQPPQFQPPPQQYAAPPQNFGPPPGLPPVAPPQAPPQGWAQQPPPPTLPQTGQPTPGSYAAPKADPWAEQQVQQPHWVPPTPPPANWAQQPAPPAGAWGAPPTAAPNSELANLQAQLTGQMAAPPPAPAQQNGPGPAFALPPGMMSAPPTR